MNDFVLYLKKGMYHVGDLRVLHHILFLAALSLRYVFSDWKKVLILITSFTIGHLITSLLSSLHIIYASGRWVDFLTPVTIIICACSNLFAKKFTGKNKDTSIYFLAGFAGLLHGLSNNYLQSFLARGFDNFVRSTAFSFGIQIGQLVIALVVLIVSFICITLLKINRREYILFLSGAILGIAVQMAFNRWPF